MIRIYFDNAATTAIAPEVIDCMADAMKNMWGNPSSIYQEGRTARAAIEAARKSIANALNASIGEIFFTSGGTESNNMALKCAVRDLGVKRIISSPIEHHAILHTLDTLKQYNDIEVQLLDIDDKGQIDLGQLDQILGASSEKTLVSLMHANNEIGTMIDLKEVGEICEQHKAYFHSDTVQTVGAYPIDLSETPIHFISGSGHKFHGPKGTGFIYISSEAMLKPFIDGGSQERNMRGGTENLYGILGMAKALELCIANMEENRKHITEVKDYFFQQLQSQLNDIQFNGDPFVSGHYKTLSVSFPPHDKNELLLLNLDIEGVSVSGGSACSSGTDVGSHVINALHPGSDRKTVRFSFSHDNTKEEVDFVLGKLKEIFA